MRSKMYVFTMSTFLAMLLFAPRMPPQSMQVWDSHSPQMAGHISLTQSAQIQTSAALGSHNQLYHHGARHPVTLGTFVQQAMLTASDGRLHANFGYSISTSAAGSTIVIGAPWDMVGDIVQAAAYVFVKPSTGWTTTSTFTAKLTASDGAPFDQFGYAVSISRDGSTIVVGARLATIGTNQYQGAAYVFVKPSTGWTTTSTFTAKLTATDPSAYFGSSVSASSDGSTVVVGAAEGHVNNVPQGTAYVFVRPTSGWTTTTIFAAQLIASDGGSDDQFGYSVSISDTGSTVAVGAYFNKVGNNVQGAVYIFERPQSGWTTTSSSFTAKLTASDGTAGDDFGLSVALSSNGSIIVVGAPQGCQNCGGSASGVGKAYVYIASNSVWATTSAFTAEITPPIGIVGMFGYAVSVSGDGSSIAVGSPWNTAGNHSQPGAVYSYIEPSTGWTTTSGFSSTLTAPGGVTVYTLGWSVSTSYDGSEISTGAPQSTVSGTVDQGAAYVFGSSSTITYSISGQVTDNSTNANPIPGVTVVAASTINATNVMTVTTDANGYYTFTNPITDTYTVTPFPGSFAFSPAWNTVSVPPSATGQNFTGIPTQYGNAVIPLRQFSPPWGTLSYDSIPYTITAKGCLLTDLAMLINYWGAKTNGFSTNPQTLNNWLLNHQGYDTGGGISYTLPYSYAVQSGVPLYFVNWPPPNNATLDSYLSSGYPVILQEPNHYVLAIGKVTDGGVNTYAIVDPLNNASSLRYYGYTYKSMEVYTTTIPSILTGLYASAHSPVELLVIDPFGNKTGYDSTTGTILTQIPNSSYTTQSIGDATNPSSPPSQSKVFYASGIGSGTYNVQVIGTGSGNYTLNLTGYNQVGGSSSRSLSGQISTGQVQVIQVPYSTANGLAIQLYLPFISK